MVESKLYRHIACLALCLMVGSTHAAITPYQVIAQNNLVTVSTNGPTITAIFKPNLHNPDDILAAMAGGLGYDHFNWFQTVMEDPYPMAGVPAVPYIDPPFGGGSAFGGWADNLPWYWDEQGSTSSPYHLFSNQLNNNAYLSYTDTPSDPRLTAGESVKFSTSLAGIYSDGTWDPLFLFHWDSTYTGTSGGVSTRRNLTPADPGSGTGGIENLQYYENVYDLPSPVQQLMIRNGARISPNSVVPIPATLWLFGSGLLGLLGFKKRKVV